MCYNGKKILEDEYAMLFIDMQKLIANTWNIMNTLQKLIWNLISCYDINIKIFNLSIFK